MVFCRLVSEPQASVIYVLLWIQHLHRPSRHVSNHLLNVQVSQGFIVSTYRCIPTYETDFKDDRGSFDSHAKS